MSINLLSIIIICLIAITLLLGLVLAVIAVSYKNVLSELYNLKEEEGRRKLKIDSDAQTILVNARHKAQNIISDASLIPNQEKQELYTQLHKLTDAENSLYNQALSEIKSQTIALMENAVAEVKISTTNAFDALIQELKSNTLSSNNEFKNSIVLQYKNDYEEFLKQLEEYKKTKMAQIDQNAKKVLSDFSVMALGRIISTDEHEEIILKSLEEAKKNNVF